MLQDYESFQDIIALMGMDEPCKEEMSTAARARIVQSYISQPFIVAEIFSGTPDAFVVLGTASYNPETVLAGIIRRYTSLIWCLDSVNISRMPLHLIY